jgi:hypothetical protein
MAVGLWRNRGHIMTWVLIPFLFAHIAIAHKELRFLFPMLLPALVMALYGFETIATSSILDAIWINSPRRAFLKHSEVSKPLKSRAHPRVWRSAARVVEKGTIALLVISAVALNFVLLPARSILPTEEAFRCFRFLYSISRTEPLVLFSEGRSIYNLAGFDIHFYRDENLRSEVVNDPLEGMRLAATTRGGLWVSKNPKIALPPDMEARLVYGYFVERPSWSWLTRGETRLFVWAISERRP